MKTREVRTVDVFHCDFCHAEVEQHHLTPCAICAREGCMNDGGCAHWRLSIEGAYFYPPSGSQNVGERIRPLKICRECAQSNLPIHGSIAELFRYVATKKAVPHG